VAEEPLTQLSCGSRIGPYTLVRFLGRGGFGEVWLGERGGEVATTRLALKLLLNHRVDLAAARQEASIWVQAGNHPNVLPLFEADVYDGRVVLVSEYAPDGSLSAWLERRGGAALSVSSAVEMMLGILAGLQHLHARGIIHRDLKPANILMQSDTPRLSDFGVSRLLSADAQTNRAAGTPAYMAPEAFEGERSQQTDIWSAGIILYQLASGRLPFPEEHLLPLMRAIAARDPEPLPSSVFQPVQPVINTALQKDPARRYPTAGHMRQELWAVLRGGASLQDSVLAAPETVTVSAGPASHSIPQATLSVDGAKAYLVLQVETATGKAPPRTFDPFQDRRVIMGRGGDCDLTLQSVYASRKHAMILYDRDRGWVLQDLGTNTGTFLNGRRVEKAVLQAEDKIGIGDNQIHVLDFRVETMS
jgi:serine/threonine-protein kinase